MGRAIQATGVSLRPDEALALWCDLDRWPAFIDGFARVVEVSADWPEAGATLVWQSTASGRGRVEERVEAYEAPPPAPDVALESHPGRLVTRVREDAMTGVQRVMVAPATEGARIDLGLDYELTQGGVLQPVTDLLFIRRAIRDALRRTLTSFAAEAERR